MRVGFTYQPGPREVYSVGDSVHWSAVNFWDFTKATAELPARLINPEQRKEISGIVGSYEVTRQTILVDVEQVVMILAVISLSLAIVNLFPFLPLDGGHIFWAIVEKVRGKPVSLAVMERAGRGRLHAGDPDLPDRPVERHRQAERRGLPGPLAAPRLRGYIAHHGCHDRAARRPAAWASRCHRRRGVPVHRAGISRPGRAAHQGRRVLHHLARVRRAGWRPRAAGLAGLGLGRGDTLAIMLTNRPEFHWFDAAALHLGATPFSLYNTYTAEQIQYQVDDAGARILVTEQAFAERARCLTGVAHLLVVDDEDGGRSRPARARGLRLRGRLARRRAGRPAHADLHLRDHRPAKGVQLTHANLWPESTASTR